MSLIIFVSGLCYLLGGTNAAAIGATVSSGVVCLLEAIAAGRE